MRTVQTSCSENKNWTCTCAILVQSEDDIIVADRCAGNNITDIRLYVNGQLTPGTRVARFGDGSKYRVSNYGPKCRSFTLLITLCMAIIILSKWKWNTHLYCGSDIYIFLKNKTQRMWSSRKMHWREAVESTYFKWLILKASFCEYDCMWNEYLPGSVIIYMGQFYVTFRIFLKKSFLIVQA